MRKFMLLLCVSSIAFSFLPSISYATTEYARQTGLMCGDCHMEAVGGGPLTKKGEDFLDDMKIKGLYRPLSKTQKIVRFIIAYIHLLTAIIWFGTILYVHILLKPAYAAKGLPRGELFLGWICIIVLAVTGTLLTIARIPSWKMFYLTRFGILLSIKIFLFLVMVSTAAVVTVFIGPKIRKMRKAVRKGTTDELTIDELLHYDGKEGAEAYIAYKGRIYDVTASRFWKNGSHLKKHLAGRDLTDVLKTAPHGEEKILSMKYVGALKSVPEKPVVPFHQRLFYVFAYMNLALVFIIVFVIALMRWS